MKKLFVAQDPFEAQFVKGVLENEGIAVKILHEDLFGLRGEIPMDGTTLPEVWVLRDDDLEHAARIMEQLNEQMERSDSSEGSWRCPQCGEVHEAQFTQCWKCGTDRFDGSL